LVFELSAYVLVSIFMPQEQSRKSAHYTLNSTLLSWKYTLESSRGRGVRAFA